MQERNHSHAEIISEILDHIKNAEVTPFPHDFFSNINECNYKNITSEKLIDEIYDHIMQIRVMIDMTHEIKSKLVTLKNGTKAYVRYADHDVIVNSYFDAKKIASCNYLRIFYAYLLAAIALSRMVKFDFHDFARAIYHVKKIITDTVNIHLTTADDEVILKCVSEGKGDLVRIIKSFAGHLDHITISYMLDHAKDWVALDEPSVPVYTVIKTNEAFSNKAFIIADEPCCELTPDQSHLFSSLSGQKWYKELSSLEQDLVMHYKTRIQSGSSVIPSRLRGIIPLNKNAFKESILAVSASSEVELINTCYHSGTVAHVSHKNKNIAENITRLNLLQQKLACQAEAMVMICLNSQMADSFIQKYEWLCGREYVPDDSEIILLTETAALKLSDKNIFYAKVCLNGFRFIEFNDYSGIDKIIAIANQNLDKLDKTLPQVKRLQKTIDKLLRIKGQYTLIDYYVAGLDIIQLLTQMVSINNSLATEFPDKKITTTAVWFGCASGENRTGITFYHNICASIIDYYEDAARSLMSEPLRQQIFKMVAKSQHILVMTGYQGNTFGTDGIRPKSSGSLKEFHPGSQLITQTSDIRALPACDASFNELIDRLSTAIKCNEANTTSKQIILIVKEYLEHTSLQRTEFVFFSDQVRKVYTDIIYTLEQSLDESFREPAFILNNLEDMRQRVTSIIQQKEKGLPDDFAVLVGMLNKMIQEFKNVLKHIPPEHLAKQGLFKSHTENPDTENNLIPLSLNRSSR